MVIAVCLLLFGLGMWFGLVAEDYAWRREKSVFAGLAALNAALSALCFVTLIVLLVRPLL